VPAQLLQCRWRLLLLLLLLLMHCRVMPHQLRCLPGCPQQLLLLAPQQLLLVLQLQALQLLQVVVPQVA
jgi:hypothetical protein